MTAFEATKTGAEKGNERSVVFTVPARPIYREVNRRCAPGYENEGPREKVQGVVAYEPGCIAHLRSSPR
jgi:hypothetical protein